ncbi:cysteine alpha-hairpin motif superfamily [Phyllosticta citriasiana]|uniref:Cytochrome c oxidase-assembly factor COX23, mitochondrial n=1 Tax=Phyllosticta citriasiana TaxID=595635 RepID=A0ABR1KD89_9PEZI
MAGDGDNDNPWTEKTAAKFNKYAILSLSVPDRSPQAYGTDAAATTHSKSLSEYYDPCQEAASRSIRCLHRNGGDRDLCSDYFQAYRDCKKQWMEARKKSRSG